jgi:hypothetical protein
MLAGVFFLLSLLMGIYLHPTASQTQNDLGVMSGVGTPEPAKPELSVPANGDVPAAPAAPSGSDKPAPPPAAGDKPAVPPAAGDKPAAPAPAAPEKNDGGGKPETPKKN